MTEQQVTDRIVALTALLKQVNGSDGGLQATIFEHLTRLVRMSSRSVG